jgi:chromosomal replication initiation ATPase DnaA
MIKLFSDRQLQVDEETIAYLLTRIERSLAAVRAVTASLDRAALSRGRRVTRALAAEVLREQESKS